METIDLSGVTLDDCARASKTLFDAGILIINKKGANPLDKRIFSTQRIEGCYVYIAVFPGDLSNQGFHVYVHYPESRLDCWYYLNAIPTQILDFPARDKVKPYIHIVQPLYTKILSAFKAQSKEDFYDDASDYQDDEPTDYGDASNYDEGLVHRIRKAIE